jgi:hypothetical protein
MVRERSTKAFKVRGAPFSELLPFFVALTPDSLKYLLHNLNKAGSTGKVLCEFVFILECIPVCMPVIQGWRDALNRRIKVQSDRLPSK